MLSSQDIYDYFTEQNTPIEKINLLRTLEKECTSGLNDVILERDESPLLYPVLLFSGGITSTSMIWKLLKNNVKFAMIYIKTMESPTCRDDCVIEVAIHSRNNDGYPLLTDGRSWLTILNYNFPSFSSLNKWQKMIILTSIVKEKLSNKVTIVWGDVSECLGILPVLKRRFGINHHVESEDQTKMLYRLMEAESDTFLMRSQNNSNNNKNQIEETGLSSGRTFPNIITSLVSSCDSNRKGSFPFLNMCGNCEKCLKWYETLHQLMEMFPTLYVGDRESHDWNQYSTLHHLNKVGFHQTDKIFPKESLFDIILKFIQKKKKKKKSDVNELDIFSIEQLLMDIKHMSDKDDNVQEDDELIWQFEEENEEDVESNSENENAEDEDMEEDSTEDEYEEDDKDDLDDEDYDDTIDEIFEDEYSDED